jgi:hypothetical protein
MDDNIYLVFRKYKKKEVQGTDRYVLYGWTKSPHVVSAFQLQRDNKKYRVVQRDYDELKNETTPFISDDLLIQRNMIDYVELTSAQSGDKISLFTTANELNECEKKVQRLFHDLSSISNIKGKGDYLNMIINLDPYYRIPLFYIGYRPEELDILYPSADEQDNIASISYIEDCIDDAYDEICDITDDNQERYHYIPGAMGLDPANISSKVIYSLESFIKVLANDM